MGQKINPLGFRLGTTQSHYSLWFAHPKKYSENLQEDAKIRDYIKNYIQKKMKIYSVVEGITRIEIQKQIDVIKIKIYTASPKFFKEKRPREIEELQRNLQKEFFCVNRKFNLAIIRIAKPYRNPTILAEFIADQLKKRVSFRKAMKKAIELTEQANTKGIRVQIAGRIDGKEIARVEWIREGRVPLQTIQAKIDYCSYPVRTISGILGIKIWIFIDGE
uniref:Small ribosomal subunit protein uS3c n=2 Tax=Lobelia TaxID=4382 RepID=A0A1Z2QUX6_9ASTR|nr:ribosomal protein S3 [Lobelia aberdarica]YP_009404191.1 ribosomal protein S3 [Lobelia bambuseti]ASA35186.1 ribosomal protein S3 [Lobelia aberdarica]ASA35456.1 ribosomal protein S3 [Lobelia bambuseti]WCB99472.1 ribosomal protein S3 [Lobelia aberdarica]